MNITLRCLLAILLFQPLGWGSELTGQINFRRERAFIHYTNNEGLPHSFVRDIIQDEHGFMWFTTQIGVCRFDGYRFRDYEVRKADGEPANLSQCYLFRNSRTGQIYLITSENRIFEYVEDQALFQECYHLPSSSERIRSLEYAEAGGYWFCQDGQVFHLDEDFSSVSQINTYFPFTVPALKNANCRFVVERNDLLYVLLHEGRLVEINPRNKKVKTWDLPSSFTFNFTTLFVDRSGNAWIGSADAGLLSVNTNNGTIAHFSEDAAPPLKVPSNFIRVVAQDRGGNVWFGSENGLCVWNVGLQNLEIYQYDIHNPEGINANAIYAIYCDRVGDVWVGTYFGGINLHSTRKEFFNFFRGGVGDFYMSGDQVRGITEDEDGNIYVGLEGEGFNKIDIRTGKIEKFQHIPGKNSLSYDNVHTLLFGPDEKLYIGTYTGGLNIYDRDRKHFRVVNQQNTPSLPSDNIYCLLELGDSILIGTDRGLIIYRVSQDSFIPFHKEVLDNKYVTGICRSDREVWISTLHELYCYQILADKLHRFDKLEKSTSISFLTADSSRNIWMGDFHEGLSIYWRELDAVHRYTPSNGFPAEITYGMIPGKEGYYWISTNRGLVKFSPATGNSVVYDRRSGLPFSQFNFGTFYKSSANDIFFGSINGLVYFNEEQYYLAKKPESVLFTDFELFNESVDPKYSSILSKPIHLTKSIPLKYEQNAFTIRYSALNYTHPGRVQYAYYLEGFDSDWNLAGNEDKASYTNLSPGKYTFHIKASYDNSEWTESASSLEIVVAPPFYLSKLAITIYVILVLMALALFYLVSIKIEKSKSQAALERKEKENLAKLNQLKLDFFTNVSHDLRTPLTLIIGPLSELVRLPHLEQTVKDRLSQIHNNAQRLLGLINQLMEFRRIDNNCEKLQVRQNNIIQFAEEIRMAFESLAEKRRIHFDFFCRAPIKKGYFDSHKVERILFNLLSNAFKFTHDGGNVSFELVTVQKKSTSGLEGRHLEIRIRDNGRGISEDQLHRIFERFVKGNYHDRYSNGSGIGLAFVKSLVQLHKGTISVDSREGKGTEFVVELPIEEAHYAASERTDAHKQYLSQIGNWTKEIQVMVPPMPKKNTGMEERPEVMIVDDDPALLTFLQESLEEHFRVRIAADGLEALAAIQKVKPDLVISDVMMPELDGLKLTRHLKKNVETSHIPIVLLTARSETVHRDEGLTAGADFYVEKPFYPHLLIKHVQNILATRSRLIKLFKKNIDLEPEDITFSQTDQQFIEKLTEIIEANIDNSDLDVAFLLEKLCISRSLLHLKLKKIVNCSATEFIRSIRLKKAAKMLLASNRRIKEIAYATGFSSPSLFSRRFKEFFGMSPREYHKLSRETKNPTSH